MKPTIKLPFLIATLSFAAIVGTEPAAASTPVGKTTVVVVHGAFDNGASWNGVISKLQDQGIEVVGVNNPLTSLADDVAATRRALDAQTGPVVLVGHSWGGMVITEIGNHPRVKSLVYVAAFAPSEGQSVADLNKEYPAPSGLSHVVSDKEGFFSLSFEGITKHFAQDLPLSQTRLIAATQGPIRGQNFEEKVTAAAWRTKPSWFVVSDQDLMIQPAQQVDSARKISAKTVRLQAGHVPQLSKPNEVAAAIIAAAKVQPK
ncbi:alpha/beta fold hydrolase [Roseateles amylovorans]|uniref:Alpha/beta hydrolase n=1 Tax=Roseateles amylovorans TaxID=2978473 RepID=A0ABY6AV30_9BURK|nr:alpha/beta hydrolase [Roseateles amylovorans]UXH76168.1 alpha/beta hydrolase [Roseateles amylovorans]